MKIEARFVGRGIFLSNGEEAIDKQSQFAERAWRRRGRSRGRGGATGGRKRPQGGNQGARQRWLLEIQTQPLNADARRSSAQSRETCPDSLRRGFNGVHPLRAYVFAG